MAKKKAVRKNVNKKGKIDEKSPPKYKTLEDAYGKNKISDQIKTSKSIVIENTHLINYCFMQNELTQKSKFYWSHLADSKINANIGQRTIHQKCIDLIKDAKEIVCISSFLFENNTELCKELYNVSKRGIRIYLLLASQVLLDKIRDDVEVHENMKSHVQFLNEAGQGYMFIRSGEIHSKFILIDPKSEDSKGILLTANITKRALEINNEIGIELNSHQTKELYDQFLYGFYGENTTEYRFNNTAKSAYLEPISPVPINLEKGTDIIWTTNQSKLIAESIENFLEMMTEEEILISCWNLVLDNDISNKILKKVNKKSKILLPRRSKNYEAISQLLEKGANIRCNTLQHAKFIMNSDVALLFSSNIESQGLEKGFESGIILRDKKEIKNLRLIFNHWYENAEELAYYNKPLSYFKNKSIKILEDDTIQTSRDPRISKRALSLPNIKVQKEMKVPLKLFELSLQSFLELQPDNNLIKQLNAEDEIIPLDYVIETIYPIEVRTINAPKGLNYMKTIKNYHIWQRKQGKKKTKKFLIFNFNPFKERKKLEDAYEISKKENAELVLY